MAKLFCEICEAFEFLTPSLFKTEWDNSSREATCYERGLRTGRESLRVSIAYNGTWGAMTKTGGSVESYEKIGYHANTAALLQGFLDSGCEVWVYRWDHTPTRIK